MASSATVLCAHCGNLCVGETAIASLGGAASDGSGGQIFFCCHGCRAVFEVLRLRGLGRYYDLKRLGAAPRKAQPVAETSENFSYLENPEFVRLYGSPGQASATRMQFYLEGVHCAACVWLVEKLPEFVEGVSSARLDFSKSVATVELREGASFSAVAREFLALGYRPHPVREGEEEAHQRKENRELLIRTGVAGACAGNIMLLAISLYAGAMDEWGVRFRWVSFLLYLPVILYSAIPFYRNALAALRAKAISIDVSIVLAMALGSGASIVHLLAPRMADGTFPHIYFDSLAAFVFLLLGSRYLLKRAQQSALDSSSLLRFLAPSVARKVHPETALAEDVPVEALRAGDLVEVRAGESLPTDGTVISGKSMIDRSLLTGESVWMEVEPGLDVFAGTVNCEAPIRVKVSQAGAASRLGKILQAAAEGATRKARIVDLADRLAKVFVAGTLVLAGGVLLWNAWTGGSLQDGVNRALAIVIVACPCALALATPLAMTVGIGRAARNGVLIKGADVVEKLARADAIFLDKTGTVTHGRFQVLRWETERGENQELLQAVVLGLERKSNHALARALVRHLNSEMPTLRASEISEFREQIGRGVEGKFDGSHYELKQLKEGLDAAAGSRIGVFRDGRLVARITLGDMIRRDSRAAVDMLRSLGLRVRLLSGDSESVVRITAEALGMTSDESVAEATPEEKARIVASAPRALMVGDGANDAVALASAYVGVSVRGGVEVSLRSADVYLNAEGVLPLNRMILEARETVKVVHRNLIFSLAYNVLGVYAALAGWVDPLFAAVLMPLSAFTVLGSTVLGTRKQRSPRVMAPSSPSSLSNVEARGLAG